MLIFFTVAAFFSTLLGGLFALYLKDRLHLILGFSAGAIVGVAFFDLIPEALELGGSAHDASFIMSVVAIGFVLYLLLDRFFSSHEHAHNRISARASSLSLHGFLDGAGVGIAFQVSPELGLIVGLAVLAHKFSDGINAVGFVLRDGGERGDVLKWLYVNAAAPVLGVVATLFFSVTDTVFGLLLALFAGFFLYIGASDLLPESHHAHPVVWTTIATVAGCALMYGIIAFTGL